MIRGNKSQWGHGSILCVQRVLTPPHCVSVSLPIPTSCPADMSSSNRNGDNSLRKTTYPTSTINVRTHAYIPSRALLLWLNPDWYTGPRHQESKKTGVPSACLVVTWALLPWSPCSESFKGVYTYAAVSLTLQIWRDHFNKGKAHSPDKSDTTSPSSPPCEGTVCLHPFPPLLHKKDQYKRLESKVLKS